MNDLTFMILKIAVSVCTCLVTIYAVPYLNRLSQSAKLQEVLKAVNTAVLAAEQTIKGTGKGAVKKELALAYVTAWLSDHAINVTAEQLDGLIEAAVYGMNAGRTE